jgi:hypothetical protein
MIGPQSRPPAVKAGTPDHEDVNIVLRLYELRREPVMRQARQFLSFEFWPQRAEDLLALSNPENPKSAFLRQVAGYWEMAATFVNSGALHEELFWRTGGEAVFVYAKLAPFLERYRTEVGNPDFLKELETLVRRRPDGEERLRAVRARISRLAESRGAPG